MYKLSTNGGHVKKHHALLRFCFGGLFLFICLAVAPVVWAGDGDGDGVADEDDFCDGVEASETLGAKGEASVIHYYFGDGAFNSLAQDIGVNLDKAVSGYDYTIALSENEDAGDLEDADRVEEPTKEEFFKAIRDVVRKGYLVDIYIFAHGSGGGFTVKAADDDEDAEDGEIDGTASLASGAIASHLSPNVIGCDGHHAPIRIVYSVSCYHSSLIDAWTGKGGAKAALGARYVNFYPNQFNKFADKWQDGKSFHDAEDASNTSSSRTASQAYIFTLAKLAYPVDCALMSPLGENACAEYYFETEWLGDDYNEDESGQWNMNYASSKLFSGDEDVTKNDVDGFDWRAESDVKIMDVELEDDWTEVRTLSTRSSGATRSAGTAKSNGQTVTTKLEGVFTVTVKNDGDYDVSSFYVTGPSDSTVDRVEVPSLGNGASTTVSFTVRVDKNADGNPDIDSLTFTADEEGLLNDTDTSNNSMTVEMKPNIEGFVNSMTTTANGDGTYTTEVQCYVRNFGFADATETSKLNLYFNQSENIESALSENGQSKFLAPSSFGAAAEESDYGILVDSFERSSISVGNAGGNTTSYTHTIVTEDFLTAAVNAFTCVADADDVIDETNESDNVETECVYCADREEFKGRLDITYDASRIMTVFEEQYLKYHDVHIPDTTDLIIIVVEYMQSAEYLELVDRARAGMVTDTQFETRVRTQAVRYLKGVF